MSNNAFILLTIGVYGGAEKRFIKLFEYLSNIYPDRYTFIVTWSLYNKIIELFPIYPTKNLVPLGSKFLNSGRNKTASGFIQKKKEPGNHPGFVKQIYRFIKNYKIQKKYFLEIDQIRKEKNINCFIGIYSGIIPLYFFLMKKKREIGIVFCDMDSWFSDVLPKEKKYWYRKYSSFNYALENSDHIDFLSPFIREGVKERGIKIKDESVSITPCSFTDYSKCKIGDKSIFQVLFAGRLEKDKNPDLFLKAAIILSQKYPEIIFHIMGEGRISTDIQSQIINSGLNNITFHGFHPEPTKLLADSSVFVSIQTTNNYPSQSVLEAMGCGNAIIATDVGDTRMFVNEQNGILISLDVWELTQAIEKLYLNKELRRQLGGFAYQYVRQNHTVGKVADYYVDLFKLVSSKYSK
jgi:glycosyltransferase involved in cell wall biosynthesis